MRKYRQCTLAPAGELSPRISATNGAGAVTILSFGSTRSTSKVRTRCSPRLLGDAPELEPLKQAIAARTEGNPFFIEEIVQGLVRGRCVDRHWAAEAGASLFTHKIPTTVRAMLAARIDRLPREEKELLQTVAAIGREFSFRLARRIADLPESRVDSALAHLQTAEFIHEQPAPGDVEYIFKHALTQEVAYARY